MGEKHLHSQGVALSAVCHDTAASLSDSAHFSAGRCIRFQMLSGWKKKKKKKAMCECTFLPAVLPTKHMGMEISDVQTNPAAIPTDREGTNTITTRQQ